MIHTIPSHGRCEILFRSAGSRAGNSIGVVRRFRCAEIPRKESLYEVGDTSPAAERTIPGYEIEFEFEDVARQNNPMPISHEGKAHSTIEVIFGEAAIIFIDCHHEREEIWLENGRLIRRQVMSAKERVVEGLH